MEVLESSRASASANQAEYEGSARKEEVQLREEVGGQEPEEIVEREVGQIVEIPIIAGV